MGTYDETIQFEDIPLEVSKNLTLIWVLPYYRNAAKLQATYAIQAVTAVFCIIWILISR